jgi:hypothetical protein
MKAVVVSLNISCSNKLVSVVFAVTFRTSVVKNKMYDKKIEAVSFRSQTYRLAHGNEYEQYYQVLFIQCI